MNKLCLGSVFIFVLKVIFCDVENIINLKQFFHLSESQIPIRISATGLVKVSGRKSSQYCASENTSCIFGLSLLVDSCWFYPTWYKNNKKSLSELRKALIFVQIN
jgi:hypothetical protein